MRDKFYKKAVKVKTSLGCVAFSRRFKSHLDRDPNPKLHVLFVKLHRLIGLPVVYMYVCMHVSKQGMTGGKKQSQRMCLLLWKQRRRLRMTNAKWSMVGNMYRRSIMYTYIYTHTYIRTYVAQQQTIALLAIVPNASAVCIICSQLLCLLDKKTTIKTIITSEEEKIKKQRQSIQRVANNSFIELQSASHEPNETIKQSFLFGDICMHIHTYTHTRTLTQLLYIP